MDIANYVNTSELAHLFAAVEGEARSEGGLVTVRVDSTGRIRDISLDPRLTGVDPAQFADAINTLCGKAFDNRVDRLAHILDDYERRNDIPPDVLGFLHASVASLRQSAASAEAEKPGSKYSDGYDGPVLKSLYG